MKWNFDGSLIGTINKNKQMHLFDPRSPTSAIVTTAHGGIKPQRMAWIGDSGKILTVGTSEFNEREWAVFDTKGDMSKPLVKAKLDNETQPMSMHFDSANEIMFIQNRGSPVLNFFYLQNSTSNPKLLPLDKFRAKDSNLYFYYLPVKNVDFMNNELVRGIRLGATSK